MEPRADQTAEILERLRTGAAGHACAGFLTTLDPLHLADLLTGLVYDRLRRKYDAAAEIYRISGQNWNQTFYTLLFRYIGDLSNQDTYTELARRATYTMVLRERRSLPRIEALLFGTSGLLDTFRPDDYIRRLRDDFAYFRARYDIEPIDPSAWKRPISDRATFRGCASRNWPRFSHSMISFSSNCWPAVPARR